MTVKTVTGTNPVRLYPKPAYGQPGWAFLVANLDLTNTLYVDTTTALNSSSDQIPPLGTMGFDGTTEVYASTLSSASVRVQVIRGGVSWDSGPALAAESIAALGLATADLQNSQMAVGIPPNVPNVMFYAADDMSAAGSPYALHTFAAASRLWYVSLALAVATDASYSGGLAGVVCQLVLGGDVIAITQASIGAPGENSNDHCDFTFGGLPVAGSTALTVNVNNGTAISDAFIRAAVVVMASTT